MYFITFTEKTSFFKLKDIFPECFLYREHSPRISPLTCLQEENSCHVGKNCMETLAKRLFVLFSEIIPKTRLILLYYALPNSKQSAGAFFKDFRSPRIIKMNPYAWKRIKNRGNIFQFLPSSNFFISGITEPPTEISSKKDLKL